MSRENNDYKVFISEVTGGVIINYSALTRSSQLLSAAPTLMGIFKHFSIISN